MSGTAPGPLCPAVLHAVREAYLLDDAVERRAVVPGVAGATLSMEGMQRVVRFPSPGCDLALSAGPPVAVSPEELARLERQRSVLSSADALEADAAKARAEGRLADAFARTGEACKQRREALADSHPLVALCELQRSRDAVAAGRYPEALAAAQAARAALAVVAGPGNVDTLAARNAEAQALYYLGRIEEMHRVAAEVWEARKALHGEGARETLETQNTVAVSLRNLGRTREAIALYEDLVARRTRTDGPQAPVTLRAKGNLAAAYLVLGEAVRASVLYEDVAGVNAATLGESHATTLVSLREAVQAQWAAGRRAASLARLEARLPDFLARFGEAHPETLRVQSLLATFYEAQGRREESEQLHRRVYAGRRAALGPMHATTLETARNIAATLLLEQRPGEALAFADATLAQAPDPARVPEDRRWWELLRMRGIALVESARAGEARAVFESTLSPDFRRDRDIERATPSDLEASQWIARARFHAGERDEGIVELLAIYRLHERRLGPDHPLTLSALAGASALLAESGREAEAIEHLSRLVERTEARIAGGLVLDRAARGELSLRVASQFDEAGYRTLAILLARRDPARALSVAELSKGRSLAQVVGTRDGAQRDERLRVLALRLAKAEETLAASDPRGTEYLQAAAERARAETELRALKRPVARGTDAPNVVSMAGALAPRVAFVSYVVDHDRVAAIVATRSKITAFDLGRVPGLAGSVEAARRLAASPDPAAERIWRLPDASFRWSLLRPEEGSRRVRDAREVFKALSDRLLVPLAAALDPAREWVISPDGPLAYLPFDVLPWRGREAIQSAEITHAVSLRLHAMTPARVVSGEPTLLGIGVSRYEGAHRLPDLPQAEGEVRAIAALFPGGAQTVLLGTAAQESAIGALDASGALARFRYVHFATHGVLQPRTPDLSAIHVAAPAARGESDGRITAAEWGAYRLNADLVVLSSCDTGLGRLTAGEGVMGLPYAFLGAGARRLLLTLWAVSDETAAEFMPRFYKRLRAGKTPAEALRETKLESLRSKGPGSSPRHWAPYVLYGAS